MAVILQVRISRIREVKEFAQSCIVRRGSQEFTKIVNIWKVLQQFLAHSRHAINASRSLGVGAVS